MPAVEAFEHHGIADLPRGHELAAATDRDAAVAAAFAVRPGQFTPPRALDLRRGLVLPGRVEPERRAGHYEGLLADTALAQRQHLVAAGDRLADDVPLLEGEAHCGADGSPQAPREVVQPSPSSRD